MPLLSPSLSYEAEAPPPLIDRAVQEGLRVKIGEAAYRALAKTAAGLKIYVEDQGPIDQLKQLLAREGRGRGRVALVLSLENDREVVVDLPGGFALSPAGRQAIKSVPGLVVEDL